MSEVMTIVILFHHSGFRNFKTYYTKQVCQHWRGFPAVGQLPAVCRIEVGDLDSVGRLS
jgi:hypothetical protein